MILQNDLFTISDLHLETDVIKMNIGLNVAHQIFKGHFPGQPILPGVCMMQIVKEVTADYTGKDIRLLKADHLKFLSFIDPRQSKDIRLELKISFIDEQIKVDAQLFDDTSTFFKFKGTFIQILNPLAN